MEAPEKIYLEKVYPDNGVLPNGLNYNQSPNDIEYTRTDAFIEKAAIWFNNNFIVHDEYGVISDSFDNKEEMFEDFVKFMKGE